MFSQTHDALLLILVAGAAGMGVGGVLAYMLRDVLRSRPWAARVRVGAADAPAAAKASKAAGARPTARLPAAPALPQVADLLLVDDSAVARAKLRRLFEPAGYKVQLACDGVEALALLQKGRYALMITDLEMPNMDGVTLINTCLAQPQTSRMPILAISGHESLRAKFNECRDICGIHRKPWVDDILLSHVATVVRTRSASAEVAPA